MRPSVRSFACLLALALLVGSGLGPAGAGPVHGRRPEFARPRVRIPLEARLRPGDESWSPAVGAAADRSSVTNEGGFLGLAGNGEISPSDTTGAGGITHVVTAVNVSYAVWPNSTVSDPPAPVSPLASGTLESLFPGLPGGSFVFDPKVVYDHYTGRFVIAFLAGHGRPFTTGPESSKLLMVTIPDATAFDQSTWCLRQLNADQIRRNGRQFGDYPGLGFDRNYIYVTSNQFDFGRSEQFGYTQVLALGKTQLYSCGGALNINAFGGKETADPSGGPSFTIQPAVTESEAGLGETEYMASFQEGTCGFLCGKRLTIWRVKKKGGRLDLASDEVNVAPGRMAPLGTQGDGSLT
ncbi:MAG: hypothetical protein ACRDHM_03880, partial [Actinomycetota bacterium]